MDRFRDNPMGFADDGFILREAMEQSFGTGLWVHPMAGGHRPGVRIELSGAENLGAERHLSGAPRVRSPPRLPARRIAAVLSSAESIPMPPPLRHRRAPRAATLSQ